VNAVDRQHGQDADDEDDEQKLDEGERSLVAGHEILS
jgi:hypothetical protein